MDQKKNSILLFIMKYIYIYIDKFLFENHCLVSWRTWSTSRETISLCLISPRQISLFISLLFVWSVPTCETLFDAISVTMTFCKNDVDLPISTSRYVSSLSFKRHRPDLKIWSLPRKPSGKSVNEANSGLADDDEGRVHGRTSGNCMRINWEASITGGGEMDSSAGSTGSSLTIDVVDGFSFCSANNRTKESICSEFITRDSFTFGIVLGSFFTSNTDLRSAIGICRGSYSASISYFNPSTSPINVFFVGMIFFAFGMRMLDAEFSRLPDEDPPRPPEVEPGDAVGIWALLSKILVTCIRLPRPKPPRLFAWAPRGVFGLNWSLLFAGAPGWFKVDEFGVPASVLSFSFFATFKFGANFVVRVAPVTRPPAFTVPWLSLVVSCFCNRSISGTVADDVVLGWVSEELREEAADDEEEDLSLGFTTPPRPRPRPRVDISENGEENLV